MELIIKGLPEEVKAFLNGKVTLPIKKEVTPLKIEEKTLFDGIEEEQAEEPEFVETEQPKEKAYKKDRWGVRGARMSFVPGYVRVIKSDKGTSLSVLRQHKAYLVKNGIEVYENEKNKKNNHYRICNSGKVRQWVKYKEFKNDDRVDIDINKFIDEVNAI